MDGGTPNQGDHDGGNHHGADANDDVQGSQHDRNDDAHDKSGDLGGDNDNQDDGHGHDDKVAKELAPPDTLSSSSMQRPSKKSTRMQRQ